MKSVQEKGVVGVDGSSAMTSAVESGVVSQTLGLQLQEVLTVWTPIVQDNGVLW